MKKTFILLLLTIIALSFTIKSLAFTIQTFESTQHSIAQAIRKGTPSLEECQEEYQRIQEDMWQAWESYDQYLENSPNLDMALNDILRRVGDLEVRLFECLERRNQRWEESAGSMTSSGSTISGTIGRGGSVIHTINIRFHEPICSHPISRTIREACLADCQRAVEEARDQLQWFRTHPDPEQFWMDHIASWEQYSRELAARLLACEGPGDNPPPNSRTPRFDTK